MNTATIRKNPFIRLATACVAAFAGNGKPSHQREAKPNVVMKVAQEPYTPNYVPTETTLHVEDINWRWRNQRQVRKARRRRWAAGDKCAFSR